jgi:hypothetical protein
VDKVSAITSIIQDIAATFALVVGGVWVLMNYVRSRTHMPRLQIELKADTIECGSRHYLLATMNVKNPGLSKIDLPAPSEEGAGPRGSVLQVSTLVSYECLPDIIESEWGNNNSFDILAHHTSIEPGLSISEQKIIHLPDGGHDAFLVRLRVAAHNQSWSAVAIAIRNSKS